MTDRDPPADGRGRPMADEERTAKLRVDCPVCGKSVAARKDGSVTHHYPPAGRGQLGDRSHTVAAAVWCAGGYR